MNPYTMPTPQQLDPLLHAFAEFRELIARVQGYAAAIRGSEGEQACHGCAWSLCVKPILTPLIGWGRRGPGFNDQDSWIIASQTLLHILWDADPANGCGVERYLREMLETPVETPERIRARHLLRHPAQRNRTVGSVVPFPIPVLKEDWDICDDLDLILVPEKRKPINARLRFTILQRDGYRCQLCGRSAERDGVKLHVDHQQPRSKGGPDDEENLWTLCADCNIGKSDRT